MDNKNKQALLNLMIEKSQESFLLAIEVYNKPTIKYRVEGFCFFICNAWELLLKAYLLKQGKEIHYKDKKNENRTISLSDAVKKVMTNENDPLRKNLEVVIGIRHMATHLIIPEYATLLNDVFMACTKNYTLKLKTYLGVSIDEKIPSDFLTMFIPHNNPTVNIQGKYGKEIFKKYIDTKVFLSHSYAENAKDDRVNDSFALSYELTFKTVSDVNEADFTMAKVAPGKSQIGVITVQKEIDPRKTHPLSCQQLVQEIKKEMINKGISFTPVSANAKKEFNMKTFTMLNRKFRFKEDKVFTFSHSIGNVTQFSYSLKLVQRIVDIFIENPNVLLDIKKC